MPHQDNELVRDTIVGNFESFRKLVEKYYKQVFNLALRLIGDRDEAEDITQETFLNIFKNLSYFNPDFKFSTWVFKVATNTCFSFLRKKERVSNLQFQEEVCLNFPADLNNPADLYERKERCEQLRFAIGQLPSKYKVVLLLKYMSDLSYKEIADTLQISVHDVETTLYRGRKMLAMRLAINFNEKKCVK